MGSRDLLYACYERAPGASPGMGMPKTDSSTARLLAEQAVGQLDELHGWAPSANAEETLRESLDHGGFTSHLALVAEIDNLAVLNRDEIIPRPLIEGLMHIAERAPALAREEVPVHADCHWGNWLALGETVTALLDFEWARFGDPLDDWLFLIRFSGPHMATVLDVVADSTSTAPGTLRAGCEIREAAHLASDLGFALSDPGARASTTAQRLEALEELVTGRYWWRTAD
jgi:hypothetical protein